MSNHIKGVKLWHTLDPRGGLYRPWGMRRLLTTCGAFIPYRWPQSSTGPTDSDPVCPACAANPSEQLKRLGKIYRKFVPPITD